MKILRIYINGNILHKKTYNNNILKMEVNYIDNKKEGFINHIMITVRNKKKYIFSIFKRKKSKLTNFDFFRKIMERSKLY